MNQELIKKNKPVSVCHLVLFLIDTSLCGALGRLSVNQDGEMERDVHNERI